ncbi:MAG: TRAP transporter small permease subunit, partial [Mariniphaga sp.]
MIAVVTLQVFTRYFMESSPHWTEEAARMLFIYAV